jgi:predicted transcriptional regulator
MGIVIVSSILLRNQVTSRHHIESDDRVEVSAIVSEFSQRLKRLEEALVDQKVRSEILDLKLQRSGSAAGQFGGGYASVEHSTRAQVEPKTVETDSRPSLEGSPEFSERFRPLEEKGMEKRSGSTEREALRIVFEGRGKTTAKEIQQRIGRTREHTARMMNGLFHEGFVERDVTVRPFTYSITQKGRDLLNSV